MSTCDYPLKSTSFDIISAKMHPIAHMSMEIEYKFFPKRSSGGRYQRVATSKE